MIAGLKGSAQKASLLAKNRVNDEFEVRPLIFLEENAAV